MCSPTEDAKKEPTPRKPGRKKKGLAAKQIHELETLAAVLTQAQLADFFGMSERTFRNRKMEDDRIDAAYKKGRASAVAKVGTSLIQQALGGNITAAIFYLKTQGGWKEPRDDQDDTPYERAYAIREAMVALDQATTTEAPA